MGTSTCIVDRHTEFYIRLHDRYANHVQHNIRVKSGRDRIVEDTELFTKRGQALVKQQKQMKKAAKQKNNNGGNMTKKKGLIISDEDIRALSAPQVNMLDLSPLHVKITDSKGDDVSNASSVTLTRGKIGVVRCAYRVATLGTYQVYT
jgi:hypothetical protein